MSVQCGICGKEMDNEIKIQMKNGQILCEKCFRAFQTMQENRPVLPDELSEILNHKEKYAGWKLEETVSTLREKGYIGEAENLNRYLQENAVGTNANDWGNTYKGSKSRIWLYCCKTVLLILWFVSTALGAVVGASLEDSSVYVLLGGLLGFLVGFVSISLMMVFLTTCENISTITDHLTEILTMEKEKMRDEKC